MEPASGFICANGINYHYLEWGKPPKPPLLLFHATGFCADVWKPIAPTLAQDFHILAFDQPGHGDSDPSANGYGFHLLGESLAALIDTLGHPEVYAVGHSSGGMATIIAASLLPGRIKKAVLLDTRVGDFGTSFAGQNIEQRLDRTRNKRAVWESREAIAAAYRHRETFKNWRDDVFQAYIEGGTRLLPDGRIELKCAPDTEAVFYATRRNIKVSDYLPEMQGEFMLLVGNYPGSQTEKDEGGRHLLELVKGARIKPLGRGSHFMPMEYPDDVAQEIKTFLTSSE